MPRQDEIHRHKKTHVAGGLDCKADTTTSKTGFNYNLSSYLLKPALILFFAVAYLPLIIALPLLPARLASQLIDLLAVEQGGM